MKKITQQQEGSIFLFVLSSIIWFFISMYNSNGILISLIGGILLGAVSTLIIILLFLLMKAIFNW